MSIEEVLKDDKESLEDFYKVMAYLEAQFCYAMIHGVDYTLGMEIHGNKSEVLHVRNTGQMFHRPRKKKSKEN